MNIKKIQLIIAFAFLSKLVTAQINGLNDDLYLLTKSIKEWKHIGGITIEYDAGSNALTNSFIDDAFAEGLIDDASKDEVNEKLKSHNRIGFYNEISGFYRGKDIIKGFTLNAALKSSELFNAEFSDDAFNLIFKGNKYFAGKSANLSDFNFNYLAYEEIKIGLEKDFKNKWFSAQISYLSGSRYQKMRIKDASLFTSEDGDSLNFTGDLDILTDGEIKRQPATFRGNGAAINLDFSYTPSGTQNILNLSIHDLGFIKWKDIDHYQSNTNLAFEGQIITDLISFQDSLINNFYGDSIPAILNADYNQGNTSKTLPTLFYTSYTQQLSNRIFATLAIKYRMNANYIPRISLSLPCELPWHIVAKPIIAYGGYNTFDFGFAASALIAKKFIAGFETFYFEDAIAPRNTTGQALRLYCLAVF